MATETLGAHLRNLLGSYQCLLDVIDEFKKGNISLDFLKEHNCDNIKELIEFSQSDKMENTLWRTENE